jgi:hypothetical protein
MSQSVRQSELFAGQDWQVLYRAFTQINFNASDPASINEALRNYIRSNYAEDFSDWIESSEFIAIVDLLSYLAGTLAFKTDINARENFLESAEARESILRLARFLSYNPRRNYPARGLLKIQGIRTDDDVYDSSGNNLQNRLLTWNNSDDPDWFERFALVLNSAFVSSHQFGAPLKSAILGSVRTQLYRLNARFGDCNLGFNANVSGTNMPFEIYNLDFDETTGFNERAPNLDSAMHCLYRADGNGADSPNTGFFMGFRQGTLAYAETTISQPTENQVIDLSVDNINETDVWVQTLNADNSLRIDWTKVPAIFSDNITFNSISPDIRSIYSVVTRDRDQVSLRFSDGRFGAAPVGKMRFWYRTSNGYQYQIRTSDMQGVTVAIPYLNRRGIRKTITLVLSLEEAVANAATRETEEQIRLRAPQLYATQGRMVSGEDYNTFALKSNQATKIKAVNRIYSGHSRFLDLNDPTGSYQDVSMFSDDGLFYKERVKNYAEVPLTENKTPSELTTLFVQPAMKLVETYNVIQDYMMRQARSGQISIPAGLAWIKATDSLFSSTGWFNQGTPFLRVGSTLLVRTGQTQRWVTITAVRDDPTQSVEEGVEGPVTLAEPIDSGSIIVGCVPSFSSTIPSAVIEQIQSRILTSIGFTLWYDYNPLDQRSFWSLRNAENIDTQPQVVGSAIKVFSCEYLADAIWRFTSPGLRYTFESIKNVRFYFDGAKAVDYSTGQTHFDRIKILKYNTDLLSGLGLGRDYELAVTKTITYSDGYADPRRVAVEFIDTDGDGVPDDPDTYYRVVDHFAQNTLLFWQQDAEGLYAPFNNMWVYEQETDRVNSGAPLGTAAFQISGVSPETFWYKGAQGWVQQFRLFRFARGRGSNTAAKWFAGGGTGIPTPKGSLVNFQWKHYAPSDHRVDPSKTNIIDMFILTTEYDFLVREWIRQGADPLNLPVAPTELELRTTFGQYESFKMFSDEIVWRPVKYKYLFGTGAEDALKATFKVVKLPNSNISDGEIKAYVARAINAYFASDFWDFGETFYFTELAAYVHQQLSTSIASIVIVPRVQNGSFGDGIEIRCRPDEIFISTAQVNDVTIIDSNTPTNLRMR